MQHGVSPYKAYEHLTAAERAKRYEKEREDEKQKWIDEGRRQADSDNNGSPDHISTSGPSVVDYLQRSDADTTEKDHGARVAGALAALENNQF